MADIGTNIIEFRERTGLSRAAFAERLGLPVHKLKNIEIGQQRADHEFLAQLRGVFDVDLNTLIMGGAANGQYLSRASERTEAPDFIPIQRFDVSASAGHGSLVGVEEGTGHYAFNRKWIDRRGLKPENLSVISVRGDSMEPALHDQDLILIDRSQLRPRDGDIYVVRYSGDLFVKHVQVMPESRIELRSANPLYGPIAIDIPQDDAPDDVDLAFIGRVVASMHEW